MSGDRLVARRVSELRDALAVKQCLQALFSYELENAELRMPPYNEKYEKEISKYAAAWTPGKDEAGDGA